MFRGVIFGIQVSLRIYYCKRDDVYFTTLLWQKNWRQNGLTKTAKVSAFKSAFVRSSPVVMNLKWRLKECWQKNRGRDGIFAKSPRCDISWQGAQIWNPWSPECQGTSPNREIPVVLVRPCISRMSQERIANQVLWAAVYTHWKAAQVVWLYVRPCLVPSCCGYSRTMWKCWCWSWGISGPPRAAAPVNLPKGKAGTKMSGWMSM